LEVQETEDGLLTITPGDLRVEEKQFFINIDKKMGIDEIYYKILRGYSQGHSKIILSGELTDEQLDILEMVSKRIVGLEVSEQKTNQMVLSELIRIEEVDLDKIINQMLSFIIIMGKDILSYAKKGVDPGDRILDKNSLITRNHNLAFRVCNIALKNSAYLSKVGKTTNDILIISRVLRHIDNIGINLIACSYLLNKEMTPGMKKFHYKTFEQTNRKFIYKSLKKWLLLFVKIKKIVKSRDYKKAAELYIKRFELSFEADEFNEFTSAAVMVFDQLSRNSYLILREFLML
jgi:hypothetical protein